MSITEEVRKMIETVLDHPEEIEELKFQAKMKNSTSLRYKFNRKKWERRQKPKGQNQLSNAVFDVIGVGLSIIILVLLVIIGREHNTFISITSVSLGILLILFFIFSSLYYFFPYSFSSKQVFNRIRGEIRFIIVFAVSILLSQGPWFKISSEAETLIILLSLLVMTGGLFFTAKDTRVSRVFALWTGILFPLIYLLPLIMHISVDFDFPAGTPLLMGSIIFYALWGLAIGKESAVTQEYISSRQHELLNFGPSNIFLLIGSFALIGFLFGIN